MTIQEIKEYIVRVFNDKYPEWNLTINNIEDERNISEIFGEYDKETGKRNSHRWWDEVEVIQIIGTKTFKYWWAEANRDDSVYELGWEFSWDSIKEVESYEETVIVTKYREI